MVAKKEKTNNEYWMTELPEHVRMLPIIYLAIPGSHNSMSYGMRNQLGVDAKESVRKANPYFPRLIRRFSRTQRADILEQLRLGVRYFDFRIGQENSEFYFSYGLRCGEVFGPLTIIKLFLLQHRGEFVILDFQNFYGFEERHHSYFQDWLKNCYGSLLYTESDGPLKACTLTRCMSKWKQLLIVYRRCPLPVLKSFWNHSALPAPFPNLHSIEELGPVLAHNLRRRSPAVAHVTQCVLTPDKRYIILNPRSSLENLAAIVHKKLKKWILSLTPGPVVLGTTRKVNIMSADFVDLNDGEFCNWVISLNEKIPEIIPKGYVIENRRAS